ncbi:hypothetical protein [Campylobacter cuniculorum]|uniref:Uncharacterized protein n=1 Tax=Campylobacter cuniculorum DSM 23162 = LMG 24588 TaxID=1121267 RepID=A0A1W6BX14_9BACT|nr:hypothetical protein [Campylobacter cuniculorum]ARJ56608.1 hypothetical protein CCUN_1003 [Campylobacter cuniculorum DSM 23162 = LMG 24588]
MKYYVTIYIEPLVECFLDCENENFIDTEDFTHAFLGLTKGKSPDELDEQDKELIQEKLKNIDWKDFDKKWYEAKKFSEFNDGFWGFGGGGQWYEIGVLSGVIGKVFDNNQYVLDNNVNKNCYIIKKLRSSQTFYPSNRCTLEISQEQYETLLANIKDDFNTTKEITPNSQKPINQNFNYHIKNNNCVHWLQKQLRMIGVNVFEQFNIPGSFMDIFDSIRETHNIFLKFQAIDSNLESILGTKTFIKWVNEMIGNKYMECILSDKKDRRNNDVLTTPLVCTIEEQERFYTYWARREKTIKVYKRLAEYLQSLNDKTKSLKGRFLFIYVSNNQGFILDPLNNYELQQIDELDLSIPANNFSANEFYPFIFIPKDEMISRMLYHKYDYGNISQEYQKDRNEFYFEFLEGKEIKDYWSESYHAINKRVQNECELA